MYVITAWNTIVEIKDMDGNHIGIMDVPMMSFLSHTERDYPMVFAITEMVKSLDKIIKSPYIVGNPESITQLAIKMSDAYEIM